MANVVLRVGCASKQLNLVPISQHYAIFATNQIAIDPGAVEAV